MFQRSFQQILEEKMGFAAKTAPTAASKDPAHASKKAHLRTVEDSLFIDLFSLRTQDSAPRAASFYQKAAQKAPKVERTPHKLSSLQAEAFARMNTWETLSPDFTARELKAAFRRLCKRLHPDQGGSTEEFRSLRSSYRELSLIFRDTAAI